MKCTNKTDNQGGKPSYYSEREWNRIMAKEAAEKRGTRRLIAALLGLLLLLVFMSFLVYYFVFRSHDHLLSRAFDKTDTVFGIQNNTSSPDKAASFAEKLCVADKDVNTEALTLGAYEAALFNLNELDVEYAKDMFTSRSPASLTKVMTALVALKCGNPDDIVVVTETALDIEYGSSVCDIKVGDRLSLKQLIYGLLIASGNDAAMMIAEHVGGSVDHFVELMNQEARSLGATGTHFCNPHGLTQEGHYTTAYDMYLMFQEAMKYDIFMDIISRSNYYAEYTRADNTPVAVTWESTNHYFTGQAYAPDNVIVYGGKTGTTEDAGACLTLLSKDLYGNPYLSVILHAENKDTLYAEMNQILSLIDN